MRLFVPLPEATAERLRAIARAEFRRPQDQAARLLIEAVERYRPEPKRAEVVRR